MRELRDPSRVDGPTQRRGGRCSEPIPQGTRGLPKGDLASERDGSEVWARGRAPRDSGQRGAPPGTEATTPGLSPQPQNHARWGRRDPVCLRAARATWARVPLL